MPINLSIFRKRVDLPFIRLEKGGANDVLFSGLSFADGGVKISEDNVFNVAVCGNPVFQVSISLVFLGIRRSALGGVKIGKNGVFARGVQVQVAYTARDRLDIFNMFADLGVNDKAHAVELSTCGVSFVTLSASLAPFSAFVHGFPIFVRDASAEKDFVSTTICFRDQWVLVSDLVLGVRVYVRLLKGHNL